MEEYEKNPWIYQGAPFLEIPSGYICFVYRLRHVTSGKEYFGKKKFFNTRTKTIKGKKKRVQIESDWREYFSSSNVIQKMVSDGELFEREILHLCGNLGTASYLEAREQFDNRVLENQDRFFNQQIQLRCHWTHVKTSPPTERKSIRKSRKVSPVESATSESPPVIPEGI